MKRPRACVVGAGIYGVAAARRLAQAGAEVTLLDAAAPGHARAASGGVSRILRFEYGNDAYYTDLTLRGRASWRALEREFGVELLREVGLLFLVAHRADDRWERASLTTCAQAGVGGEALDPPDIARRWPAISPDGVAWALANANGGFLHARRATQRLAAAAERDGVTLRTDSEVVAVDRGRVELAGGDALTADHVLVATGAWAPRLVDAAPVQATRQVSVYLDADPGPLPVFGEGAPFAYYGFPAYDGLGLKVSSHVPGPPGDPGADEDRRPGQREIDALVAYTARRFPATRGARVASADVCFYALTPTADPVVDRLDDRTVVCAGFSGHGFKFAPVVAAAAADLLLGHEPGIDLERFRWPGPEKPTPATVPAFGTV